MHRIMMILPNDVVMAFREDSKALEIEVNEEQELIDAIMEVAISKAELAHGAKMVYAVMEEAKYEIETKECFIRFHLEIFDQKVVSGNKVLKVRG